MDAYADFIAEVSAGGFRAPAGGGWTAEQVAAHVAWNQEQLITVTEAVLAAQEAGYDNRATVDVRALDRYVAGYGGLRGLADRVAETATALRDLAGQLAERANTLVPVRIQDGDDILVDQPLPWGKLLELEEEVHLPRRTEQLRALRD
jgi:O-glycosyl hydrolase